MPHAPGDFNMQLFDTHLRISLSALACAALTACGGGGDSSDPAPSPVRYLEGPVGQVVALAPEILSSGTYTVSNCFDQNDQSVNRKLRLGSDGSIQWLDAANDAVLAQFTPSATARQYRNIHVMAGGGFDLYVEEQQSSANTLNVSFDITPSQVRVRGPNNLDEQCEVAQRRLDASARASSAATPVVNIPLTLNDTIVARRLASAVLSTGVGATGQISLSETFNSGNPPAITVYRVERSVSAAGAISSQINTGATNTNPPIAWGNWITNLLAATSGSSGGYREEWDALTPSNVADVIIRAELEHPNLNNPTPTPADSDAQYIELRRNPAEQADGKVFMSASPS